MALTETSPALGCFVQEQTNKFSCVCVCVCVCVFVCVCEREREREESCGRLTLKLYVIYVYFKSYLINITVT